MSDVRGKINHDSRNLWNSVNFMKYCSWFQALLMSLPTVSHGMDLTWASAYSTGSPRLELFALSGKNSPIDQSRAAGIAGSLGATHSGSGLEHLYTDIRIGPSLRYDGNINNGIHQDNFTLDGLRFTVDEGSRAISGVLAGASLSAYSKFSYASGSTLSVFANTSFEKAVTKDLTVRSSAASACVNQYLYGWNWAGICHTSYSEDRALSKSNTDLTAFSYNTVYSTGYGLQEFIGEIGSIKDNSSRRRFSSIKFRHATNRNMAFTLGVYGEQYQPSVTSVRSRVELGVSRLMDDKIISFSGYQTIEGGGYVFGTRRHDVVHGIKFSKEINRSIEVNLHLKKRQSNVDIYDGTDIGISFDIPNFTLLK